MSNATDREWEDLELREAAGEIDPMEAKAAKQELAREEHYDRLEALREIQEQQAWERAALDRKPKENDCNQTGTC